MKLLNTLVVLFCVLAGTPALAESEKVLRGPVPDWVDEIEPLAVPEDVSGLVFIRRQDMLVHLDDTGQSTFTAQHFVILHPQALQVGNVGIVWDPAAGDAVVHRLNVHRDGQIIDVLETSEFEVLRREDQLELAMLDGIRTAILRVPDLRIGDELDFAFTIRSSDPTLGEKSFGSLYLADAPPPGRIRLGIDWIEGQKPVIQVPETLRPLASYADHGFSLSVDNAPAYHPPKDAPPRYFWERIVEFGDFSSWKEVSALLEPLYANAAKVGPDSPILEEARRIAGKYPDKLSQAQAALELVQREIRYVYVGLNGGNLTPVNAEATWRQRYGDCKGKTALLLALLEALDIEAYPVMAHNQGGDDGLDERIPSPGAFDHVLVRAGIDGQTYWLDGTLPQVARMETMPVIPYRFVLPLSEGGSDLAAIEQRPFSLPQEMGLFDIDASAGFDQPARKVITYVKRGIEGLKQYAQLSPLTSAQLDSASRDAFAGDDSWDEIERVTYRYDRETLASILTIEGIGPVDWDDEGAGAFDLVLPGGGFNPPNRRRRPADQDQAAPFYSAPDYSCSATTVHLPEGTDLDHWGFNSVFDTMIFGRLYYRMMQRAEDGTIRMVRGSRTERPEITRADAARDNARIDDFDNSKAVIHYDPDRTWNRLNTRTTVPGVHDFDWTAPDAPCLPKDVLGEG